MIFGGSIFGRLSAWLSKLARPKRSNVGPPKVNRGAFQGNKLARKAAQHKLGGRFSKLAWRLEVIALRKKGGLSVAHLTNQYREVRA